MVAVQILLALTVLIPLSLVLLNRIRMDAAALIIAILLGITQYLGLPMLGLASQPKEAMKAISGFGQPVVITLVSLFILTHGLEKSGVTRWIAHRLMFLGRGSESRLIGLFTTATAILSLFMNNLAAGALILPSAMEVARRTKIRPSKLLIPVAFGSLLGGSATYFTTANIIVNDLLQIANPPQSSLRIYDFTPTGGLIALAGILFLTFAGKKLLPDHPPAPEQMMARLTGTELEDIYQISERLWEARVKADSPVAGLNLAQIGIGHKFGVEVAAIWHGQQAIFPPSPEQVIWPGDILLLIGREDRVNQLQELGFSIGREKQNGHLSPHGVAMLEIILAPRSMAVDQSLVELNFRRRYGFTAVALRRMERSYRTNVGEFKLALGDSLLVIGAAERVRELQMNPDFIVLQPSLSDQPVNRRQALLVSSIVVAAIVASILGLPVYLSMLAGAILMILTGYLKMDEAYHSIEWQAIFIIAGMYAVSLAMVNTGLADRLGHWMIQLAAPFGPLGLAAGSYGLTALFTQFMGGQVSALVTGPVAISAAIHMGTSPQAVAVATAIGCSASFFTPFAHPVNILMVAPANYTFRDFFTIGWRLTIICFLMLLIGMVIFWGL